MPDQAIEQSVEDRLAGLLTAEEEMPEEEVTEGEETTEEAQESEEETEAESPAVIKLKWNGEEVEKPLEEVVSLAQQGFDYTQKTQKLADERREIETYAQAVKAQEQGFQAQVQIQQAFLKELATVKAIDDQIAAYAQINWQSLSDSDPVQAQKLFFTYSQLQNQKQAALGDLNTKHQQAQQVQEQRMAEIAARGKQELPKLIPNFNDSVAKELQDFARNLKSDIASSFNPNDYKVLWMANEYAKLQASKPQVTNKVTNKPPVVKPGGRDTKTADRSKYADERAQLRKSGRDDIAAKLIERML